MLEKYLREATWCLGEQNPVGKPSLWKRPSLLNARQGNKGFLKFRKVTIYLNRPHSKFKKSQPKRDWGHVVSNVQGAASVSCFLRHKEPCMVVTLPAEQGPHQLGTTSSGPHKVNRAGAAITARNPDPQTRSWRWGRTTVKPERQWPSTRAELDSSAPLTSPRQELNPQKPLFSWALGPGGAGQGN